MTTIHTLDLNFLGIPHVIASYLIKHSEGAVIIDVKAVEKLVPVHEAQLLTYLKLSGKRLGFLINFNVAVLRDGLKRKVL